VNKESVKLCTVIIIVDHFNKLYFDTIESCICQVENICEIIILDNSISEPLREEILFYNKRYPDLIKFHRNDSPETDNGFQVCLSWSTGKYIQLLKSGDTIFSKKLQIHSAFLEENTHCDVAYSGWQLMAIIEPTDTPISSHLNQLINYPNFLDHLLLGTHLPLNVYLLKKEFVEKSMSIKQCFDDLILPWETTLIIDLVVLGVRFGYVPGIFSIVSKYVNYNQTLKESTIGGGGVKQKVEFLVYMYFSIQKHESLSERLQEQYLKELATQILQYSILLNIPVALTKLRHNYNNNVSELGINGKLKSMMASRYYIDK
jgi:hypothetical protein